MTYEEASAFIDNCTHQPALIAAGRIVCELSDGRTCCSDCFNSQVYARRQARKEQLATEARCEVDGCRARGAFTVGNVAQMCRKHMNKANGNFQRKLGPLAFLAMVSPVSHSRESLLKLAAE